MFTQKRNGDRHWNKTWKHRIDLLVIPHVLWPIPHPMYTDTFYTRLQTRPNLLSWLLFFIVERLFPRTWKVARLIQMGVSSSVKAYWCWTLLVILVVFLWSLNSELHSTIWSICFSCFICLYLVFLCYAETKLHCSFSCCLRSHCERFRLKLWNLAVKNEWPWLWTSRVDSSFEALFLANTIEKKINTRKSSCVNARGIPPAA